MNKTTQSRVVLSAEETDQGHQLETTLSSRSTCSKDRSKNSLKLESLKSCQISSWSTLRRSRATSLSMIRRKCTARLAKNWYQTQLPQNSTWCFARVEELTITPKTIALYLDSSPSSLITWGRWRIGTLLTTCFGIATRARQWATRRANSLV